MDPIRCARRLPADPQGGLRGNRRARRGDAARLSRRLQREQADAPPPRLDREPRREPRRVPLQPQPRADRLPRRGEGRERSRAVLRRRRSTRDPGTTDDVGPRRRRARGGALARAGGTRASPTLWSPRSRTAQALESRPTSPECPSSSRTTPATSCRTSPTRSRSRAPTRSSDTSGPTPSSSGCSQRCRTARVRAAG